MREANPWPLALEPACETRLYLSGSRDGEDVWATDYTRRALDGTTLSAFITDLTLGRCFSTLRRNRRSSGEP